MHSKVPETYEKMKGYLDSVFHGNSINAVDSGWSIFRMIDNNEIGEITVAAAINGTRVEVRRVLTKDCDPDMDAQSIVGELLMKIDQTLNEKNDKNEAGPEDRGEVLEANRQTKGELCLRDMWEQKSPDARPSHRGEVDDATKDES